MTPHEAERIAAAFNQLRPDWPIRQLETLLREPTLVHRPRRDVTVALGWVACENRSYTPYRVLEAGPWWQAAAVDADTASDRLAWPDDAHRCRVCSMPRGDHERLWKDDHPFEPARQVIRDGETMHHIVEGLRNAKLDHVAPPPTRQPSTAGTQRVQPLRDALEATRGRTPDCLPFCQGGLHETDCPAANRTPEGEATSLATVHTSPSGTTAEPDTEGVASDPVETPTEGQTP